VTTDEEAQLIAEVEGAKADLRTSLRKSKALIAAYRKKLTGMPSADGEAKPAKPLFNFKR